MSPVDRLDPKYLPLHPYDATALESRLFGDQLAPAVRAGDLIGGIPVPRKRIYVAGPMRGYPQLNFPAFDAARDALIAAGYAAVSPADMDRERGITPETYDPAAFDFADAMTRDIRAVLDCDGLLLLRGWAKSAGARTEAAVNRAIGHPFLWMTRKNGIMSDPFTALGFRVTLDGVA